MKKENKNKKNPKTPKKVKKAKMTQEKTKTRKKKPENILREETVRGANAAAKIETNTHESKGENAHLARWIAPSFILTNGEALVYRFCAVSAPFMIIWSILQESYIVSITFFLTFGVSIIHLVRKPEAMECIIDVDGIKMGDRSYDYKSIESFEIDNESRILKFKLKNAFLPLKEIYLEDQNPDYIRAVLGHFLPEEKQEAVILNREKRLNMGSMELSEEELRSYLEKMERMQRG